MLRKYLRRVLPSHDTIRGNKYIARFGHRLQHHNLWHLHRRSVAGGVAVGMFAGLIPGSNPVQFTAGALLAIRFKVNLPLSVLVTLYSNPFTIVPLYYVAFLLGQLVMLQGVGGEMPHFTVSGAGLSWLEWLEAAMYWVVRTGKPLLVGLPLLALILTGIGYFATGWAWRLGVMWQWHLRKKKRQKN